MTFIGNVLLEIRKDLHRQYTCLYDESMRLDDSVLYQSILNDILCKNLKVLNDNVTFTYLPTSGCCYGNSDEIHGCSFCNYLNDNTAGIIKMKALQYKNPEFYDKLIRKAYNSCSCSENPSMVQFLSGFDSLNMNEISSKTWESIFEQIKLNSGKSLYGVFVTRADSVTKEKLQFMKDKIGKRTIVEFGTESSHEWIRTYWLNKGIMQSQLVSAIKDIKQAGLYSQADVLIGIPGLTQKQSQQIFISTCTELLELGVDYILCSPLVLKNATLQHFIFHKMRKNERLIQEGILNTELGTLPEIYSVFDSIYEVLHEIPSLRKRMIIGPVHFPIYYKQIFEYKQEKENLNEIMIVLNEYQKTKDYHILCKMKSKLEQDKSYRSYRDIRERENGMNHFAETIKIIGKEISDYLWGEHSNTRYQLLLRELENL
jgi:radical SAM enzyme (TIGR01210 family)